MNRETGRGTDELITERIMYVSNTRTVDRVLSAVPKTLRPQNGRDRRMLFFDIWNEQAHLKTLVVKVMTHERLEDSDNEDPNSQRGVNLWKWNV